jgi:signal transduction histidine kinase
MPILRSFKALLRRMANALAAERDFTAVAAHELRTPLAGIRAQAQAAATAPSPLETQEALSGVIAGVDRAARVLDQLLDLARVDGLHRALQKPMQPVDLASTYHAVRHELGPRAAAKHIAITARFSAKTIQGLDFPLYLLMRNLIANAIQYCPEGGRVDVSTCSQGHGLELCVDDSGPGIPLTLRDQAFDRFNRLGHSETEGSGLGLSIVAQVVELHQAGIQLLDSPLGGLRVQVLFRAFMPSQVHPGGQALFKGSLRKLGTPPPEHDSI